MSTSCRGFTAFVMSGHLYAAEVEVENFGVLSSVERYDVYAERDSWCPVADMHHCRQYASVAVVGGEADGGGDMDLFGSLITRVVRARH